MRASNEGWESIHQLFHIIVVSLFLFHFLFESNVIDVVVVVVFVIPSPSEWRDWATIQDDCFRNKNDDDDDDERSESFLFYTLSISLRTAKDATGSPLVSCMLTCVCIQNWNLHKEEEQQHQKTIGAPTQWPVKVESLTDKYQLDNLFFLLT